MRRIVLLLIVVGLVLPRATAVLAAVSPLDLHSVVICTPEGLRTVTLGPDGQPVDPGTHIDHCPLIHVLGADSDASVPGWSIAPLVTDGDLARAPVHAGGGPIGQLGARGPPDPV